jgi:16S rRNA (uracil1498-N3)-methyltransferase
MRRRFFVDRFNGRRATLSGDAAHHAARVLRVAPGQLFELSDGRSVWLARVEGAKSDAVTFSLLEPVESRVPQLAATLLLSIVKFNRFEWALEKATELGVSEITPLAAARSEKALVAAAPKRAARWQKILLESAQQSRRLSAPILHPVALPGESFRAAASTDPRAVLLFFSEAGEAPPLRAILEPRRPALRASLAIGPEGGWTDEERSSALAAGFAEVSLGPNILRTETAVASALASIRYALAD